jgi:hypothetical protein
MASWHPDGQSLAQLYQLITNSKSPDAGTRNEAAQVRIPFFTRQY